MKKLQKIRDEYADQIGCKHFEDYSSTFGIDVDDVELLMKRAYNQALKDVKEKATQPDSEFYDCFIDENLIQNLTDKLKVK